MRLRENILRRNPLRFSCFLVDCHQMKAITKDTTEHNYSNFTLNDEEIALKAKKLCNEYAKKAQALREEYANELTVLTEGMEARTALKVRTVMTFDKVVNVFQNGFQVTLNNGEVAHVHTNLNLNWTKLIA